MKKIIIFIMLFFLFLISNCSNIKKQDNILFPTIEKPRIHNLKE